MPETESAAPGGTPIPEVRGLPLVGVAPWLARDIIGYFVDQTDKHGTPLTLRLGGQRRLTLMAHPDELRHVLHTHAKHYVRGSTVDLVRPLLGNGLPLSDGPHWLRQRRTMQPVFTRARIAAMVPVMLRVAERYADQLKPDERLLTFPLMMRLTRDVIVETMFSGTLGDDTAAIDEALATFEAYIGRYSFFPVPVPLWLPTPDNIAFRRAVATLDRLVYGLIAKRRAAGPGEERDDLLGALLAARDPQTGEPMSDTELRDEVLNIFVAGHETTATLLTWTTSRLSLHPEVAARLREEHARVLDGRDPTADDLAKLEYTTAVLQETLRLHPPAFIFARVAERDDVVRGFTVPKGTVCLMSPYLTHRMSAFWPDPERFEPERFLRDRSLGITGGKAFTYLPFGAGPHICIGNHFAMTEAAVILVALLRRVALRVEHPDRVRPGMGALLRVAGGLPVQVVAASP